MMFVVCQLRTYQSVDLGYLRNVLLITPLQSTYLEALDIFVETQIFVFVWLQNT